ncbi:MAG: hypothetical protein HRU38_07045 [Saccharospirillaceae bacterium]|nr:hypothetical protein [Saccharospirillaceae bacterium]
MHHYSICVTPCASVRRSQLVSCSKIGQYKGEIALQFEETLTAAKLLEAEALIALTEAEQKIEITYSELGKKDETIAAFK